jgi:hypothetical protein
VEVSTIQVLTVGQMLINSIGCRGRDHMVVGFITTFAISALMLLTLQMLNPVVEKVDKFQ